MVALLAIAAAATGSARAQANISGNSIDVFDDSGTLSSDMTCTDFNVYGHGTLTVNQGVTLTFLNCQRFKLNNYSAIELHGTMTGSAGSDVNWTYESYINVYLFDGAKYTVTGLSCSDYDGDNYLRYYGYDAATDGNGTVSVTNGSTAVTASSIGYKTTTYTFTATPASGYHFVSWTKGAGGEELGTEASIDVTCEQNGQYQVYANFEEDVLYTVTFAEGTEDAANWTVTPAEALTTGVLAGTPLTATYVGDLKVKEVIATKHQEPNPLTIEALTAGIVMVQQPKSGMQYTLNGGPKTAMTGAYTEITVAAGDKVQLYGNGTSITSYNGTSITGTAEVKAYGNIMSLVNETGFDTATTLTANEAFSYLFVDYANLKDISGLKLPATTLTSECYSGMFYYCTGLTTVPSDLLPATTLARSCYSGMFSDCANLTNVPTLPATTLAVGCYNNMFSRCTGLTTVPTDLLPATTLAEACYSSMFLSCRNLTSAPALPATTLAERCYYCMFQTCENLAASPVLPATTLVERCYNYMFANCHNLRSVTCLATSGINQNNSTTSWLNGAGDAVQGTKIFNAASSANWPMNSSNGIPSGWTRQNIDN